MSIRIGEELIRALQHREHGKPTCLPAVFHDAVKKRDFVPRRDFLNSQTSIYKQSWVPSISGLAQWALQKLLGSPDPDKLPVGDFVVLKNVEVAANEILKRMKEQTHTSTADRILSRTTFLKRFSRVLNPAAPLTANDLNVLLLHMCRDKQALAFNAQTIKFRAETETELTPVSEEDTALANLRDAADKVNAQLPALQEKIAEAELDAREAVRAKHTIRAKAALKSKKLAEHALAERSHIALELEEAFMGLQRAADQVHIVEAMKAGAEAMKGLHEKVGGVEGVQNVMDEVREQTATVDEITSIINESATAVDEGELDEEFEALEKAERERKEKEEAEKTAARLAELEEVEKARKDKEAAQKKEKEAEEERTEQEVQEAEEDLSKLSFAQEDEDADEEPPQKERERALVAA